MHGWVYVPDCAWCWTEDYGVGGGAVPGAAGRRRVGGDVARERERSRTRLLQQVGVDGGLAGFGAGVVTSTAVLRRSKSLARAHAAQRAGAGRRHHA